MTAVGLDVGTTSLKGIALKDDGTVAAIAESSYPVQTPRPGWSEQDPELWWSAAQEVLGELSRQAGAPRGIGLSGQMHGLVALDRAGEVLRPALLWNDQRTAAEAQEIEQRVGGLPALVAATGNRALTGFTAPKLLWMQRHEPELFARTDRVLLPKDYVRLRLSGERATDVTDASGTLWFDVEARSWSRVVLDALGVSVEWLPPALESFVQAGTAEGGVAIAAGAGDQGAGAVGVGAIEPGTVSIVLGTSGVVCSPLPDYAADPEGRLQSSCHALEAAWFAMGVILSAAGSLAWLARVCGASAGELVAEAERWPPGCEGLVFLPYLSGERAPHYDSGARGAFVGLNVRHDRGALTRAVLEGVAFALRDSLDLVRTLSGEPVRARASGGGARSELWLRIVASVLELEIERPQVEEGAAFGAALLGGVVGGIWSSPAEAVDACVRIRSTVDPDPVWTESYREPLQRFRSLYPALRPLTP